MTSLTWHDLQWCLQRAPKRVLATLKDNPGKVFVAGGFIRSCVSNTGLNGAVETIELWLKLEGQRT